MRTTVARDEVTFELRIHDEDMPVRGNAMASGDNALDKQVEDEILARLDRGDTWAWCCVEVIAKFRSLQARTFLGGCCYRDEADFKANSIYYEDMMDEAYKDLLTQWEDLTR